MITEVATVTVTILIYFFCYQNNETTISQCFGKYLLLWNTQHKDKVKR